MSTREELEKAVVDASMMLGMLQRLLIMLHLQLWLIMMRR